MTKEALKLALDFVASISPAFICEATHHKKNERHAGNEPCPHVAKQKATYEAIKEALAQPEQEPLAWLCRRKTGGSLFAYTEEQLNELGYGNISVPPFDKIAPLYTTPPQRTWVGLTDEELADCMDMSIQKTCRAIEAKLKEKNTWPT